MPQFGELYSQPPEADSTPSGQGRVQDPHSPTPSAPSIVKIEDIKNQPVVATTNKSPDDFAAILGEAFPLVTKDAINQFMNFLLNMKIDKNINHKMRIQVLAKIFECSEKEASRYYKAFKIIYKFQKLKQLVFNYRKGNLNN